MPIAGCVTDELKNWQAEMSRIVIRLEVYLIRQGQKRRNVESIPSSVYLPTSRQRLTPR